MSSKIPLERSMTSKNPKKKKGRRIIATGACFTLAAYAALEINSQVTTGAASSLTQSVMSSMGSLTSTTPLNFTSTKPWVTVATVADPLIDGVSPKADAPEKGMFSPVLPWAINAIHLAMLPNGKVMGWGPRTDTLSAYTYDFWDTSKGTTLAAHTVRDEGGLPESFCGSATILQNGKMLISEGGNGGVGSSRDTTLYDPVADKRELLPAKMADDRWYATMIKLPDGRPIILGGMDPYQEPMYGNPEGAINGGLVSMTPEVYENGAWRSLFGANSRLAFGPDFLRSEYPRAWVAPNGKVFGVSSEQMWFLDANANNGQGVVKSAGAFKTGLDNVTRPNIGSAGAAVMYAPGKVLKVGGNGYWILDGANASNQTSVIDIGNDTASYTETAPMKNPRRFLNATVLADGQVFAEGGSTVGAGGGNTNVLETEMWNPKTGQWSTMATMANARIYHHTAMMLPNGTAVVAGGGGPGPVFNPNAEVFYPPYLFKRNGSNVEWAKRPIIKGVTGYSYENNEAIEMEMADDAPISKVVLMGFSVVTHSFNSGQRYIPMEYRQTGSRISAITPNANLTPPGYYYALALDANGVPSKSIIISVGAGITPPPGSTTPFIPSALIAPIAAPILDIGGTAQYKPELNTPDALVSWNFGDGSPATDFMTNGAISHQFAKSGVYLVTLTVQGKTGVQTTQTFLQTVKTNQTPLKANSSTTILVDAKNSNYVWSVNPDNNSVSVLDAKTLTLIKEIPVGLNPESIAQASDGNIWVVNKQSSSLSVIDNSNFGVLRTIPLARGVQPHGLVFSPNNSYAYVALEATGQILRLEIDGTTIAGSVTQEAAPRIRHLTISGDGNLLYVSRYVTPHLPGEETATIDTTKGGAEVVVLNALTLNAMKTILLTHSKVEDGEMGSRGIPNYLGAMAISPDGLNAYVPSKMDNVLRGGLRDGQSLNFQNTVRAISSKVDLGKMTEVLSGRVDHDNSSVTSAALYHPSGAYLFVALETSREIAVVNTYTGGQLLRVPVGLAPQGLALSADGTILYVQNFMDRTVSVVDFSALINNGKSQYKVLDAVKTVKQDLLTPTVLRGKQLFYDAADTRLTRDKYMSCASCHSGGMDDGRVWDLTNFGEGLRNTVDLRGHGATAQGALHWSANFDEIQDFEMQIRNLAGGVGLMDDAVLNVGTRKTSLGDKKAGFSADLDALAAYVASLSTTNISPFRASADSMTSKANAGRSIFADQCASCHGGTQFTLSGNTTLIDVGTIKSISGKRLGSSALLGIDPPTLKGVWQSAPYLHDGSASTIEQAIRAHTKIQPLVNMSAQDLCSVVDYLRQIEDTDTPLWPTYLTSKLSSDLKSYGKLGSTLSVSAHSYKIGDVVKGQYLFADASKYPTAWVGVFRRQAFVDQLYFSQWANASAAGNFSISSAGWIPGEYYVALYEEGNYAKLLTTPIAINVYSNNDPLLFKGKSLLNTPLSTGLRASYFDNNNFQSAPVVVRNEAIVHNWGVGTPDGIMPPDNFSVRWEGELVAPETGLVSLQTNADDRIRVWLDDQLLIDRWTGYDNAIITSKAQALVAGNRYRIKVEYIEYGGNASATLLWKLPSSTAFTLIPVSQMLSADARNIVGKGQGLGLLTNYFSNNNLSGNPLVKTIDDVNYEWQYTSPLLNMPSDNFSMRLTGFVEAPMSGEYTFRTLSDDGIRMWFADSLRIDNWTAHWPTWNYTTKVKLRAGQKYPIKLEYVEYGTAATMKLQWQMPNSTVFSSIPKDRLYSK